jgi:hypothetical protein
VATPQWQETRRRVALAGIVTEAGTRVPVADATVEIVAGPAAFRRLRERAPQRAVTTTGRDGLFHFLDLPGGQYSVTATVGRGTRYGTAKANVRAHATRGGELTPGNVELSLPPTRIKGRVRDAAGVPIPLAAVRVHGERATVMTAADGRFVLSGFEVGTRRLEVTANGFAPASVQVTVTRAGAAKSVDLTLSRASS